MKLALNVVSGLQPSGRLHLGNYFGALAPILNLQNLSCEQAGKSARPTPPRIFFELADLHSMTSPRAASRKEAVHESMAMLLASGLDPDKIAIFRQSDVPEHTALMWMLMCNTSVSRLLRMIQWKEKASTHGENCGLLVYPVLQAADILLYDADLVVVGPDQAQHLELTSRLVQKINGIFPDAGIKKPEAHIFPLRIMDLRDSQSKMSKSSPSRDGCIFLDDTPESIRSKIMRAVTGSHEAILFDKTNSPGISSLIEIFALVDGTTPLDIASRYSSHLREFSRFKSDLSDAVISKLSPIGKRYGELIRDRGYLEKTLAQGREKAAAVAYPSYKKFLKVFL